MTGNAVPCAPRANAVRPYGVLETTEDAFREITSKFVGEHRVVAGFHARLRIL